jgi:subtilisin family serine protease
MRKFGVGALGVLVLVVLTAPAAEAKGHAAARKYVVAYEKGVSLVRAERAVRAIGGRVVATRAALRIMLVRSSRSRFQRAALHSAVLKGAVRNHVIGRTHLARTASADAPDPIEIEGRGKGGGTGGVTVRDPRTDGNEPLAAWQWDMRMMNATPTGSYGTERGKRGVIVAVIDTGIDGSHPDIAPNFNKGLSRNWTTDIPLIDGKCEQDPDKSCSDPNDVDEDGHGTHVAGTIAAPINGLGMAGVAPGVTLVNDRAGQDSGFFFLWETVNALKYAGDIGADVANMSFYTDPWQFNCPSDHRATDPLTGAPTDSPQEQAEQNMIRTTIQAAVDYAVGHKVTLVAAAGNFHSNLVGTKTDDTSPDYPPGTE